VIYLLDADHMTFLQEGSVEGETVRARLRSVASDDYGTTIVSYEEQCKGWLDNINRAATPEARVNAYKQLKASLRFYVGIAVWDYDAAADAVFVALTKAKVRVGTKDLRIASIALANDATLLTRNTRDFARVPNLRFEDWSV
jgi:tRNA(fMet)-specific endonuclease VapC